MDNTKSSLLRSGAERCYSEPTLFDDPEAQRNPETQRTTLPDRSEPEYNRRSGTKKKLECYRSGSTEKTGPPRKLAHTIPEAVRASGISRSALYLAIGRGALQARKCGARTLILDSDLRRLLRKLPPLKREPKRGQSAPFEAEGRLPR
jgi:hypothetical protein